MIADCAIDGRWLIGPNLARHLWASGRAVRTCGRPPPFADDLPVGDRRIGKFDDTDRLIEATVDRNVVVIRRSGRAIDVPAEVLPTGWVRDEPGGASGIPIREGPPPTADCMRAGLQALPPLGRAAA